MWRAGRRVLLGSRQQDGGRPAQRCLPSGEGTGEGEEPAGAHPFTHTTLNNILPLLHFYKTDAGEHEQEPAAAAKGGGGGDSEGEEGEEGEGGEGLSKKKRKLATRLKITELKQVG